MFLNPHLVGRRVSALVLVAVVAASFVAASPAHAERKLREIDQPYDCIESKRNTFETVIYAGYYMVIQHCGGMGTFLEETPDGRLTGSPVSLIETDDSGARRVTLPSGVVGNPREADVSNPPAIGPLVSNVYQTTSDAGGSAQSDYAQPFTTGSHGSGYVVVEIFLDINVGVPGGNDPTTRVQIWSVSDDNQPLNNLGALSTPSPFVTGLNTFSASDTGIHLQPDTTYFILVDFTPDGTTGPLLRGATSTDEGRAAAGWSLGDEVIYRSQGATTWDVNNAGVLTSDPLKVRIRGYRSP